MIQVPYVIQAILDPALELTPHLIGTIFFFRAWDCDACVGFVGAVADVYGSDEGINAITLALEGEAFCKSDELALDEDAMQKCFREIKHFMPRALLVIKFTLHQLSKHICRDWFHGICHDGF